MIHVGVSSYEKGVVHLETCAHSTGYIRKDINGCCLSGEGECTEDGKKLFFSFENRILRICH